LHFLTRVPDRRMFIIRFFSANFIAVFSRLYERVKDWIPLNTPVNKVVIKDKKSSRVETKEGLAEVDRAQPCLSCQSLNTKKKISVFASLSS
jgi:hypothetical protein